MILRSMAKLLRINTHVSKGGWKDIGGRNTDNQAMSIQGIVILPYRQQ
jgi:hypothetical protein